MSADNVLFHTLQTVYLSADSSLAENLCCLLERSSTHEALCTKGSTGNTLQHLRRGCWHCIANLYRTKVTTFEAWVLVTQLASRNNLSLNKALWVASVDDNLLTPYTVVFVREIEFINKFLLKEDSIAWVVDANLTHHLANDNLEVLIVDLHTLQTVNVLYLINDVLLHGCWTFDCQDIRWCNFTVRQGCASTNSVVLLNKNLTWQRNKILALLTGLRCNNNLTVTTLQFAHSYLTINFRNNSRCWWVTSLKEFLYTWQTTSNTSGAKHRTWNTDKRFTSWDCLSVFNVSDMTAYREVVRSENIAVFVLNINSWNNIMVFRFDDNTFGHTRCLVGFCLVSSTLDDVVETKFTCILADNNRIKWVPTADNIALLHLVVVLKVQWATIRYVHSCKNNLCIRIDKLNFGKTAHYHLAVNFCVTALVNKRYGAQTIKLKFSIVFRLDRGISRSIFGHTTRVEGTKCKLCTRLTDSLCSDNADSLAKMYHFRGSQVATIALATNALLALTGKNRTNFNHLNACVFDSLCSFFGNFFTCLTNYFVSMWVDNVVYWYTSENTLSKGRDNLVTIF